MLFPSFAYAVSGVIHGHQIVQAPFHWDLYKSCRHLIDDSMSHTSRYTWCGGVIKYLCCWNIILLKSENIRTFPTFRDMRRRSWRIYQKTNSVSVLSSGNTDSLSVLVCEETTLTATATVIVQVITYSFYGANSGNVRNCHTSYNVRCQTLRKRLFL